MEQPETNLFDIIEDTLLSIEPEQQIEFELSDVTSLLYSISDNKFFSSWIDDEGDQYEDYLNFSLEEFLSLDELHLFRVSLNHEEIQFIGEEIRKNVSLKG